MTFVGLSHLICSKGLWIETVVLVHVCHSLTARGKLLYEDLLATSHFEFMPLELSF